MKLATETDIEDVVLCDVCNKDFTESDESGGFLFGSKAVCPDCDEKYYLKVVKTKEQTHIKGLCPLHLSFKEWVVKLRTDYKKVSKKK